jgi:hypothetical protein
LTLTGQPEAAIQTINAGMNFWRSAGATATSPLSLPCFATAYANLGQFDDAWRTIREALTMVETTKERWGEAEVQRREFNGKRLLDRSRRCEERRGL